MHQDFRNTFNDQFSNDKYQSFLESIEKFGESPQVHFNLACCYSMLNDAEMTYLHLEKAVANGLDNLEKIHDHKALAFIRQDEKFNSFVKNNYKRPFDDVPNEKAEIVQ